MQQIEGLETAIAIVGMSGRFPKSPTLTEFWQKLRDGEELISFFSEQELLAEGLAQDLIQNPHFVKAAGVLENHTAFDAAFFGYSPREAEVIDPQQRVFLLCAHEALEHAGYLSDSYTGRIGVFAGASMNTYIFNNLFANRDFMATANTFQILISNDKDFLATRVSYKLDLHGPSLSIQTACSTSLVAVHVACQNLLYGECDIALAGAVSIGFPHKAGYIYHDGEILSPDGHCRSFDAKGEGTIGSNGAGVVALKRLTDALNDGDTILAVIRGTAINNDGAGKIGYTAPSVDGQAQVIAEALSIAAVPAESISYIEAHGTATPLGDPIEIAALNQVYRAATDKRHFCAIGSVKSNLGHLDAAAGMAGLIKTVLALQHKALPPSLHFEQANPNIDFDDSPFFVNTKLTEWGRGATPRRAGVSSFGIGGTNSHVILEEAPPTEDSDPDRPWQLLLLSARTPGALETATDALASHLEEHVEEKLADVAFTLQVGRKHILYRRAVVCRDRIDAIQALRQRDAERIHTQVYEQDKRQVIFLFPGQGAQYPHMGRELYDEEPLFQQQVDYCTRSLKMHLGLDLRELLYPAHGQEEEAARQLSQTRFTQPALFVIEYALSKLWMSWGIEPQAMIGHSIGEYVAACLAGVFSLEDALALVALRGRFMQETVKGGALSVPLPAHEIEPLLSGHLALAAENAPSLSVVSGSNEEIETLQKVLKARGIETRLLQTSHAFHSSLMDPILQAFEQTVAKVRLQPPTLPYISNVTGTWISEQEATNPRYWARHMRQTVRFASGLQELSREDGRIFLEVGPGRTLSTFVRQTLQKGSAQSAISSLRHPHEQQSDRAFLLNALGKLWLAGAAIHWPDVMQHEQRHRIPLPTYPFELQHYYIVPQGGRYQPLVAPVNNRESANNAREDVPQSPSSASTSLYTRPALQNEYVAPENAIEERLATIWQENLGIEHIGVNDNFFELGGHSLMATQIISQIQATFPIEISLRNIFESPTIARLGAIVEEKLLEKLEEMSDEEVEHGDVG